LARYDRAAVIDWKDFFVYAFLILGAFNTLALLAYMLLTGAPAPSF
jgi:hypothetical protein